MRILPFLTLTIALALLFPSVGSGSVTMTLQPISLTMAEGSDITLTFTVDNNSGVTILPSGLNSSGGNGFLAGDLSDEAFSSNGTLGTCGVSSLASGASCTFTQTFHSPVFSENVASETDADFSLQQFDLNFSFFSCNVPDCSSATYDHSNSVSWNLTVTDPGFTGTTPEPPSVLLFSTGLLGLLPVLRRFARI